MSGSPYARSLLCPCSDWMEYRVKREGENGFKMYVDLGHHLDASRVIFTAKKVDKTFYISQHSMFPKWAKDGEKPERFYFAKLECFETGKFKFQGSIDYMLRNWMPEVGGIESDGPQEEEDSKANPKANKLEEWNSVPLLNYVPDFSKEESGEEGLWLLDGVQLTEVVDGVAHDVRRLKLSVPNYGRSKASKDLR